jgi:hypothetical protein
MRAYAGIGSRDITDVERRQIEKIASVLAKRFIVYSGNAEGSDIAFQTGSRGKCVIFIPWNGFNDDKYSLKESIECYEVGEEKEGRDCVVRLHPNPSALRQGGKKLMARNFYQVAGFLKYPEVEFVICCALVDKNGKVKGGTSQAVRLAEERGIPVINIRVDGWKERLIDAINKKKE